MDQKVRKAVILAGGFGTRLMEETEARPKPMVEIGGRPMLWQYLLIPGIGWGSPTGIDEALDATMGRLIQARDGSASRPHLALA